MFTLIFFYSQKFIIKKFVMLSVKELTQKYHEQVEKFKDQYDPLFEIQTEHIQMLINSHDAFLQV